MINEQITEVQEIIARPDAKKIYKVHPSHQVQLSKTSERHMT
jgi:hypothetical protein